MAGTISCIGRLTLSRAERTSSQDAGCDEGSEFMDIFLTGKKHHGIYFLLHFLIQNWGIILYKLPT